MNNKGYHCAELNGGPFGQDKTLSKIAACARFCVNRETFVNHIRPDYLYIEEQNSFNLVKTLNETSNCHLHQHGATFVKVI